MALPSTNFKVTFIASAIAEAIFEPKWLRSMYSFLRNSNKVRRKHIFRASKHGLTVTGVAHKNKNELQGTWYTSHWVWLCIRPQIDPPNLSIVTDLQHCTILCRLIWYFEKNEPYMCEEANMSSSKRTCVIRRGTATIFRSFSKRPFKCFAPGQISRPRLPRPGLCSPGPCSKQRYS